MATKRSDVQPRLLGIAAVESFTGQHRSTIGRKVAEGTFPAPLYVGIRRRWRVEDLEKWVATLKTTRAA